MITLIIKNNIVNTVGSNYGMVTLLWRQINIMVPLITGKFFFQLLSADKVMDK